MHAMQQDRLHPEAHARYTAGEVVKEYFILKFNCILSYETIVFFCLNRYSQFCQIFEVHIASRFSMNVSSFYVFFVILIYTF